MAASGHRRRPEFGRCLYFGAPDAEVGMSAVGIRRRQLGGQAVCVDTAAASCAQPRVSFNGLTSRVLVLRLLVALPPPSGIRVLLSQLTRPLCIVGFLFLFMSSLFGCVNSCLRCGTAARPFNLAEARCSHSFGRTGPSLWNPSHVCVAGNRSTSPLCCDHDTLCKW